MKRNHALVAIITALILGVLGGHFVWPSGESCDSWKHRESEAFGNALSYDGTDKSNERRILTEIQSQRPAGCEY